MHGHNEKLPVSKTKYQNKNYVKKVIAKKDENIEKPFLEKYNKQEKINERRGKSGKTK